MHIPEVHVLRYGAREIRVLFGGHLVGTTQEMPGSRELQVIFYAPTGQQFPLVGTPDPQQALASILTAALHYTYRPHEIGIRHTADGYRVWCPTCQEANASAPRAYPDLGEARERSVADHENACGQPAVLVGEPTPLEPAAPPPNSR